MNLYSFAGDQQQPHAAHQPSHVEAWGASSQSNFLPPMQQQQAGVRTIMRSRSISGAGDSGVTNPVAQLPQHMMPSQHHHHHHQQQHHSSPGVNNQNVGDSAQLGGRQRQSVAPAAADSREGVIKAFNLGVLLD